MADHIHGTSAGTPPAGGRQNHYAMRADAMRPITGPGSTDTLAAGGGLELPGHVATGVPLDTEAPAPEPIPGEWDRSTLTHREPGAFGGGFAGARTPAPDTHSWLTPDVVHEYEIDGGGREQERHHGKGKT